MLYFGRKFRRPIIDTKLIIEFISLFFAGLLAGEEFIIRFGVRGPISSLEQIPHIKVRIALIRTLRIIVPILFMFTLISGLMAAVLDGYASGIGFRLAGLIALIAFFATTMCGTVPINAEVMEWNPGAPPRGWQSLIKKWEFFNTIRCISVVFAFVFFLISAAMRLCGSG